MEYIIKEETLVSIADAIRAKSGKSDMLSASEFADEITNLPSGGGSSDDLEKYLLNQLDTLNLPDEMEWIPDYRFAGASVNITSWNKAKYIGSNAFRNFSGSVPTITEDMEVNSYAFFEATLSSPISIKSRTIYQEAFSYLGEYGGEGISEFPEELDVMGDAIFSNLGESTTFGYVPNRSQKNIDEELEWNGHTFSGSKIETASIGNDCPYNCFADCSKLKSVTFRDNTITDIRQEAFRDCQKLENITLPRSITNIEAYAFQGIKALGDIVIPSTVETVGYYVFNGFTGNVLCEASSKPDGWDNNWSNGLQGNVVWGFVEYSATINFVTNLEGVTVNSVTGSKFESFPKPTDPNSAYRFDGWYTDSALTTEVSYPYRPSSTDPVTLYGKWSEMGSGYNIIESDIFEKNSLGEIVGYNGSEPTTDAIYIDSPVLTLNDDGTWGGRDLVLGPNCTSLADAAFSNTGFVKVLFLQSTMPQIGGDVFSGTWDAEEFEVYVDDNIYSDYENTEADWWYGAIVETGKLKNLSEINLGDYDIITN